MSPSALADLFYNSPLEKVIDMGRIICESVHGKAVHARGLIEFTNHCTSNCLYCGIRKGNRKVQRYRMDEEQLLGVVQQGVKLGLKTFVLQGGEDPWWTTARLCRVVDRIKQKTGNRIAVTLSCGMKTAKEYMSLASAGGDRYLLRFETSDSRLHATLRPGSTLEERLEALENIRSAGFQVGSGFMTGLPGETASIRLENILLCQKLKLDMVGIGPFIPHPDTPLAKAPQKGLEYALQGTALLRLGLPFAHIPATTAAGTLAPKGREQMLSCGANVLMPNITPGLLKKSYQLYPGKICIDESGREAIASLQKSLPEIDRFLSFARGDGLRLVAEHELYRHQEEMHG